MRPLPLVLLPLAALVLSQCGRTSTSELGGDAPPSEVLATVAGRAITADDLREEAAWRVENRQPVPDAATLLDEMVRRLALVEKARQAGLEEDPATRRRIESLLIARLRETGIDRELQQVPVSDEELRAAYDARRGEFARPGMDRFAILFQDVPDKSSEARRQEARERLEAGLALAASAPAAGGRGPAAAGFGAAAIDHSDDQVSRYRGGDIGWVEESSASPRVPDEVLEAGRALAKGGTSAVIETDSGLYVIMKTDSRAGGVPDFDAIKERLRQGLLGEKRRELEARFVEAALESAAVTTRPEALRDVDLPASSAPEPATPELPADPSRSGDR